MLVAALQVGLVASLGGKYLYDRLTQPRVWVQAASCDLSLPVRGRYVRLQLVVAPEEQDGQTAASCEDTTAVSLRVQGDKLIAIPARRQHPYDPAHLHLKSLTGGTAPCTVLDKTVALFIPGNLPEAALARHGQELWVEVSVPASGLPRPIRLGRKKGGGHVMPLGLND
jgi:hypothetical protein